MDDGALLEEQKAYYRARAPEYDEWFLRRGPYDGGPEENRRWWAEFDEVRAALRSFAPSGQILELACGTGWWTKELAPYAEGITAVDASPEVIELNRQRMAGVFRVDYVLADLFQWEPSKAYDVVFFSFWLSHVPADRFRDFWEKVRIALEPEGRVFFVDSLQRSTAVRMSRPAGADGGGVEIRTLGDGREFRVVKIRYDAEHLQANLAQLGWVGEVTSTERFFIYGQVGR